MNFYRLLICVFLCIPTVSKAQSAVAKELSINPLIDGTLLIPEGVNNPPLVILIAGSGPTDRNGNQAFMKNNMLKKLAVGLSKNGIACFRYDKRIVKQLKTRQFDNNIRFDDFVTDAKSVVNYFKSSYKEIIIAGHSQGSLVGMLAVEAGAQKFISLAGAANTIDHIILEQIKKTAPVFAADTKRVLDILKEGKTTTDFPVALSSLFNIETQTFIGSWMNYNPMMIVNELEIPTLIINGTKDLQVSSSEALLLKDHSKDAQLYIIENMNHLLFEISGDDLVNSKSYNEIKHTVMPEVLEIITNFIKKEKSIINK